MKIWEKWRASLAVGFVFLSVTLVLFSFYNARTLKGNIDNHILPSEMFGMPEDMRAHGLTPLYGPKESGWDGQFYFYMSNDILGVKDTAKHIDAPSYRYQRIGLSLYAAIVAKVTGRDWVSPTTFFVSYLALVFAATLAGARLLQRYGAHPAWMLLWSFSVGTQLTLFNALPDAAADAFLILALFLVFTNRVGWSFIPFAFAALSREVYALFPSAILGFVILSSLKGPGVARRLSEQLIGKRYVLLLIPGIVAVAWNVYVTRHFGASPSSQAHGILGLPLAAWAQSMNVALHPASDGGRLRLGSFEFFSLAFFLLVLVAALRTAANTIRLPQGPLRPVVHGVAASLALFALLYACFGPTVTGHFSGYFKAVAVFFFLIPLLVALTGTGGTLKRLLYGLLVLALLHTSSGNLGQRVFASPGNIDKFTRMSALTETRRFECFGTYEADVKVNRITLIKTTPWGALFGGGDQIVVNVALTNTGQHPFVSSTGFGSVFMSYHWNDAKGATVVDGIRSALPRAVEPGHTVDVDVVTPVPPRAGLTLRLSPVQEGCAWFYQANPKVGAGLPLAIER
ncbi:hypothetical protein QPK31_24325 [Massilia sp. YIM B02769]|uniref:hypothetical protein n=1 Tax=unclassified Massilia TaxID=2609279 RepID=UPI0025B71CBF|nr:MULTISPECIES: hypothetical protein [unclassified Massilia]MDN4061351.1 hypothetical protein [Massilia sp. YIM B02769]